MHKPDVAIVDIRMPPTHTDEGLRAAQEIGERYPDVGVLVLSQYVESAYAMELLAGSAEGVGYLLKDRVSDVEDFAAAVRRVAEGGSALDPAVVQMLVGRRRADDPLEDLTPREREVLEQHGRGAVEPGDIGAALHHAARGREARHEHLPEAAPAGERGGPPARARGARLPAGVARPKAAPPACGAAGPVRRRDMSRTGFDGDRITWVTPSPLRA